MDEQRRSALDWLAKAERDYEAARRMIDEPGEPLLDAGVYHCQQAAEKALKGWLTGRGVAVTKTHDLVHLVRLCAAENEAFTSLIPASRFLPLIRWTGCRRSWSGRWRSGPSGVASPPRAEEIGDG